LNTHAETLHTPTVGVVVKVRPGLVCLVVHDNPHLGVPSDAGLLPAA